MDRCADKLGILARTLPLIVVATLLFPCSALTDSPSQVFDKASPSTVVVAVYNEKGKATSLGSGVVIGTGQVVTNCHVTRSGKNYKVRWQNQAYAASLAYSDLDRDLCQLNVPGLAAPAVSIGSVKALKVGSRVYAIGAPQGLELSLSEGIVSSLRDVQGSKYIQTTAAISPGSSGGGLFDDQARLIGITTFYLEGGQSLNFALPVDWITELPKRAQTRNAPPTKGFASVDWFNKAAALQEKKDWKGLLLHSQKWVRAAPRDAVGWVCLGLTYNELHQYAKAVEAFQEAIRLQPDDATSWIALGMVYGSLNQQAKAIEAFQEAIRLQPDDAGAWYDLGRAYYRLGQYDKATEAYRESIRLQPDDAGAWYDLGVAYYFSRNEAQARAVYPMLKKLDPVLAEKYFQAVILP